jgi:hypothetical protein
MTVPERPEPWFSTGVLKTMVETMVGLKSVSVLYEGMCVFRTLFFEVPKKKESKWMKE